jgi:proton-coupled amino acid transporter
MNVIKAVLGAGAFALPWAFANGGLVLASSTVLASLAVCVWSVHMLVKARQFLPAAKAEKIDTYTELAAAAISEKGGLATELMVLVCCFGIASAYMVFVADTLATVITPAVLGVGPVGSAELLIYLLPLWVGLSWIKEMSGLSLISLLGNVSCVGGMAVVAQFATQMPSQLAALPTWNPATFPQWFGSVAFLFFTHFSLPGIESAMADKSKFSLASFKGFAFCAALAISFGVMGAIAFGPAVGSNVITDLQGTGVVLAVKLLLCFNLLATFPVVCRTAFLTIEKFAKMGGFTMGTWSSRAVRTAYTVAAGLTAVAIPNFGRLLGVVGGFCCSMLTCFFPAMMYIWGAKAAGRELTALESAGAWGTMVLGVVLGVLSVFFA